MLTRVLIANRGEIAIRIARTCRALGIETVAVFSEADRRARHVAAADRAVLLGPAAAAKSYLDIARVVDAARRSHADAIHPGYGFLSENAALAAACAEAGITFVGPSAAVIERFGSKITAREVARQAGVPVVPGGVPADQTPASLARLARETGFPVLLKPAAGGGGKGMVRVGAATELDDAIARARREAVATVGDGTLYVERLLERPRHVEVQLAADRHGGVLALGERNCSIQRRHQKVVEESPSPAVSTRLRQRMETAAIDVAREAGYDSVGTAEFLVDGAGDDAPFYFLEMNTRLQVEHPVTELVTGIDLVEGQLAVAAGERLPWTPEAVQPRGHAIECRLYAEDPDHDFLPQAGVIVAYHEPSGPGIRIDSGIGVGSEVPVHYDPLLAKVIAHGETREQARRRLVGALRDTVVLGVRTNLGWLRRLLEHDAFVTGDLHVGFIAAHGAALQAAGPDGATIAAVAAAARAASRPGAAVAPRSAAGPADDVWSRLGSWRLATGRTADPGEADG